MEKTFKDEGIDVKIISKKIILSGNTDKYEAEMTNLGGHKLKNGNWSLPLSSEKTLVDMVLQSKERDLKLNPENMSTPEVLSICKAEELALDTENRESCIKGADESKPYIDPFEISIYIREELEKWGNNVNNTDPRIVYDVIVSKFGSDIAPLYKTYLPLYQQELEKMKEVLDIPDLELSLIHTYEDSELFKVCFNWGIDYDSGDIESCKVALFSKKSPIGRELREKISDILGLHEDINKIPIPFILSEIEKVYGTRFIENSKSYLVDVISDEMEKFMEEEEPKVRKTSLKVPRKQKIIKSKSGTKKKKPTNPLDLNKNSRDLFKNIREGILTKIITFGPDGVDFLFPEIPSEKSYADVKDLMEKQDTEYNRDYTIRRYITSKISKLTDLKLTPDTVVLLGYLFAKKIIYAVEYDVYTEAALGYVQERL